MTTYIDSEPLLNQAEIYFKKSVDLQTRDGICLIKKTSLAEGSTVLDLGCGTGNLTAVLAEKVGPTGRVLGIDPDRERINVAKESIKSTNITFVEADGETFPENQYDLVFSNYVFHWIENKRAVFKRVFCHLRPGGEFALTFVVNWPIIVAELLEIMEPDAKKAILQIHHLVPEGDILQLATETGFKLTHQDTGVSRLPFKNYDGALEFMYASSHGLFDMAKADKKELEQLKQKYMDKQVEFAEEYVSYIFVKT